MAELKLPRLLAAAKEFNVGQDTLIYFLEGKGFHKDDLKPTSKLSEDMYRALQLEFQGDKVAKLKSDQIDLPKGSVEAKKKKEEEAVVFKKETPKKVEKVEEEKPEPVVVVKVEEPKKVEEPPVVVPEVTKVEAPELEGPKVVDKIDLSTIDSSTRPKKGAKPAKEEKAEPVAEKPKAKGKKAKPVEEEVEPVKETPAVAATAGRN